jgi:hypothetical protein
MKQLRGLADFKQSKRGHELLDKWEDTLQPLAIFEANYIYFKVVTGFYNQEAEDILLKAGKQNVTLWPLSYEYKAKWLAYFFYLMGREGIAPHLTWRKQNKQLDALADYFDTPRLKYYYYQAQEYHQVPAESKHDKAFADKILPLLKTVTFLKA